MGGTRDNTPTQDRLRLRRREHRGRGAAGVDLTGKLAVVTGGHSGLGLETTRALAAGVPEMVAAGLTDEDRTPSSTFEYKTPEQGAATQVWAATSARLDGIGGVYLEDCDIAEVAAEGERDL